MALPPGIFYVIGPVWHRNFSKWLVHSILPSPGGLVVLPVSGLWHHPFREGQFHVDSIDVCALGSRSFPSVRSISITSLNWVTDCDDDSLLHCSSQWLVGSSCRLIRSCAASC